MALQGCYACIKYLVIFFNFLFWLAGIGVLALSIYSYVKGITYATDSEEIKTFFTPLYILMAAGSLMTILGFLGCCGALKESQCMLGTFFFLVLIILVSEITAGVWAYLHQKEAKDVFAKSLTKMIQEDYGKESLANKTIDAIQHDLQCCGSTAPNDWAKSNFNKLKIEAASGLLSNTGIYDVPTSCCRTPEKCITIPAAGVFGESIYKRGCVEALEEFVKSNMQIIAGVGIGLGVIQLLGLMLSIILCCAIRNGEGVSYHV